MADQMFFLLLGWTPIGSGGWREVEVEGKENKGRAIKINVRSKSNVYFEGLFHEN